MNQLRLIYTVHYPIISDSKTVLRGNRAVSNIFDSGALLLHGVGSTLNIVCLFVFGFHTNFDSRYLEITGTKMDPKNLTHLGWDGLDPL